MITSDFSQSLRHARELEKNGDFTGALDTYRGLLCNERSDREIYLNLGGLYVRMGRFDDALLCYDECMKHGEDYLLHYNIGSVYYRKSEFKKSIFHMDKSRNLNGAFMPAALVMGMSYSRLRNIKAAEANFNLVLNTLPYNRTALVSLAALYAATGRFDDSLILLDRVLANNGASRKIHELKSAILMKAGRVEESAEEVKTISRFAEEYRFFDDFIRSIPVEVYTDKYGTLDEKIEILRERSNNDPSNLISLSLCHLFKGDTSTAIDCLFQARKRSLN